MGKSKPIVVKEEDYMKRLLVHNIDGNNQKKD